MNLCLGGTFKFPHQRPLWAMEKAVVMPRGVGSVVVEGLYDPTLLCCAHGVETTDHDSRMFLAVECLCTSVQ